MFASVDDLLEREQIINARFYDSLPGMSIFGGQYGTGGFARNSKVPTWDTKAGLCGSKGETIPSHSVPRPKQPGKKLHKNVSYNSFWQSSIHILKNQ